MGSTADDADDADSLSTKIISATSLRCGRFSRMNRDQLTKARRSWNMSRIRGKVEVNYGEVVLLFPH